MKTILSLECTVLVPHDSTTVTVDWNWSKNISECGKNVTEEQGRFNIHTSRLYVPQFNAYRITKDLIIESPGTDTGYYWCQVNDHSYNGVFISSNKAPVFDTGTMTICSGTQYINQSKCAIGSVPPLICVLTTSSFVLTITSISTDFVQSATITPIYVISSINTGNSIMHTSTKPTESLKIKNFSQITYMSSTMSLSYGTPSVTSLGFNCNNKGLISGLVILSIVMFGLGGVLGGLLTIMWNKRRCRKGICHIHIFNNYYNSLDVKNPSREEKKSANYNSIK